MKKPTFVNNSPTNLSLQRFKRKKGAVIGLVVLILLILSALFSDILTPYEFDKINPINALRPPSLEHPMGTDAFGRDQLTRIMHGGKVSLQVGMISVLIGGTFGILMGAIAGFFGGWIDEIVSRFIDIMLAFPSILLALAVVSVLGPDLYNLMIAVGISSIPAFARLVRSAVLSIKENDYIVAARSLGLTRARIVIVHIIPNIFASILVFATLEVATAILAGASLNFLGMGAKPPTPEWGLLLAESRDFFRRAWWLATFPGIAIMVTVISINLLGDGLRDTFDPWLKEK
ncbi:MAG: glutathione ABC transporter permease GsiD [Euryarchaeota archaeon]|nr:glutathione ABC transporter permease GsiD [Euryarchaeota archaeon]